MVYIKPWDSTVFENFFVFLKTIQDLDDSYKVGIAVTVAKELRDQYNSNEQLRLKYGLEIELQALTTSSDE